MRISILLISLLVWSSCDPCKRLSKPKYKACFNVVSDTITVKDTFTYHDTIIIEDKSIEWLIRSDTVINTEWVYYSRKGDTTVIICKGDTIYRNKEVVRDVKVPVEKFVYKERIKWWWLWVVGIVALVLWVRK